MAPGDLFAALEGIHRRPALFERITTRALWTDPHRAERMLSFHLDGDTDVASRRTERIDGITRWLVERFDLASGRRVADFGCGPGLYTHRLAAAGAEVTGIDFSASSLRHARSSAERDGLRIEYVEADYLGYRSEARFDLILMTMGDFCALAPEARRALLEVWREHLAEGGAVAFDVYTLARFEAQEERHLHGHLYDGFWSAEPYWAFLDEHVYPEAKVSCSKSTVVLCGSIEEHYVWFQHYDEARLAEEIGASGFAIRSVYADLAGAPRGEGDQEMGVIAQLR